MKNAAVPILFTTCVALLQSACSSAPPDGQPVAFYNAFRTGAEALPTSIEGCESLGSVSATAPEPNSSGVGFYDPKPLLETLGLRARRKGADTAVVLLPPGRLQQGSRTLRATVFRCGSTPVPASVGVPVE
jgi:hypothetical protein